jgi:lipoprotein-anchoring transpeptidase ErfK/SrfK
MVFRTAGAVVTVLIGLGSHALAQYYPPPQAYPRQPPPATVNAGELPPVKAPVVQRDLLPPVGVGPAYQPALTARYEQQTAAYPQDDRPAATGVYYGLGGAVAPGPAGSVKQDSIRKEATRSRLLSSAAPPVTGSMQGHDPGNLAALPPVVRPETEATTDELAPQLRRTLVDYRTNEPAGTIIIDTPNTYLYLVLGDGKGLRYGIGVGREGFTWSGAERITRMLEWPDWTPPEEMIARQPYLPRFMAGGETNPLGARALYLGNTIYRIHGTNQPSTIGTFVSSGCIRLTNEDVMDLHRRVRVGTRVLVLPGRAPARDVLGSAPTMLPGNTSVEAESPSSAMVR